jgi:hypothetical protein
MLAMEWTTPDYTEIKMDAEIGSYQEDGDPVPIVEREDTRASARRQREAE